MSATGAGLPIEEVQRLRDDREGFQSVAISRVIYRLADEVLRLHAENARLRERFDGEGSAASLPTHLLSAWNAAAWVIWNALREADESYDIAADVVKALDKAGHLDTRAALSTRPTGGDQ